MDSSKPSQHSTNFLDPVAQAAEQATKSTYAGASDAMDSVKNTVQDIRQQAAPFAFVNEAKEQAGALAQRGVDTLRDTSQQLRDKALRVSDSSKQYIKDEPVKSMLIAAAAGAALMVLLKLKSRSRHYG